MKTLLVCSPNFIKNHLLMIFFLMYPFLRGINLMITGFDSSELLAGLLGVLISITGVLWFRLVDLNITLTIDEEKTILQSGVFNKKHNEIRHTDVKNIQIDRNFIHNLLGVGTVGISSAGQGGIEIKISGIEQYWEVKEIINNRINLDKKKPEQSNIISKIKNLSELRDDGLISDDEFKQKKQQLLEKL